jgi:hypothetical protein
MSNTNLRFSERKCENCGNKFTIDRSNSVQSRDRWKCDACVAKPDEDQTPLDIYRIGKLATTNQVGARGIRSMVRRGGS